MTYPMAPISIIHLYKAAHLQIGPRDKVGDFSSANTSLKYYLREKRQVYSFKTVRSDLARDLHQYNHSG